MKYILKIMSIVTIMAFSLMLTAFSNLETDNLVYRGEKWHFDIEKQGEIQIIRPERSKNAKVENGFVGRINQEKNYQIIELN